MIKINHKILSVPPYISTTWNAIAAVRVKNGLLLITLLDGVTIEIPDLTSETIEKIFELHSNSLEQFLEAKQNPLSPTHPQLPEMPKEPLIRFSIGSIGDLAHGMKHNPDSADSPEIPQEILEKIVLMTKSIIPSDILDIPEPEINCNCVHCQISRALIKNSTAESISVQELPLIEEEVSNLELSFNQWDVKEMKENLYTVTNKLDPQEQYNVFLGSPIGCTCGSANCEHIIAALRS